MSFPKRLDDALHYNEQKVAKGIADLLDAPGYFRKVPELNFYHKREAFELRNSLNERATSKTIHISLSFSPQDRNLDEAILKSIARDYMQGIGFGDQPYLVYRHRDAGHPHLHIVSTTIREDGSRIATHNLGKVQSSKTREALEKAYKLLPAKGRVVATPPLRLLAPSAAQYGKEETKSAIAQVVNYVFRQYAFSTLPQYNAALRQFGVVADGGTEGSRIYRHGGLVYRVLDERGCKVGVPIKASSLPGKPTLAALEQKFTTAGRQKEWAASALLNKLARAAEGSASLQQFTATMAAAGVYVLPRTATNGSLYGITFVDNRSHTVFNGSELGKRYSAAALIQKFGGNKHPEAAIRQLAPYRSPGQNYQFNTGDAHKWHLSPMSGILTAPTLPSDTTPPAALTKKRRRKAKGLHNL